MLQVHNLTVEVGGRNVVEGATFTIMARDKVGIVGRNGAGKTSMFKVLGGDNEPAGGKVTRSGAYGYLSQDPRTTQEAERRSAISHILSGRSIDEDLERLEKLRVAMEENADERNVSRFIKAEDAFNLKGGYSAE
ncbi:MAG: ATP-binding cassette domain-containing protein, partial [Acidimicrobiaceae bacterium]